jgi:hypothetical protein
MGTGGLSSNPEYRDGSVEGIPELVVGINLNVLDNVDECLGSASNTLEVHNNRNTLTQLANKDVHIISARKFWFSNSNTYSYRGCAIIINRYSHSLKFVNRPNYSSQSLAPLAERYWDQWVHLQDECSVDGHQENGLF